MVQNQIDIDKELFEPAIIDSSKSEGTLKPSLNYWQDVWQRVRKNKGAIVSLVVVTFLVLLAFIGPFMSHYEYSRQKTPHANLPPRIGAVEGISWLPFDGTRTLKDGTVVNPYQQKNIKDHYWFGTDNLGRDQFSRIWKGTQISLYIAFLAALIDLVVGVAFGSISGFFGGRIDTFMQRIIEILSGIPNLVVVILMIIVLKPGIISITAALSITGWVSMARVVRAQVLKLKNQEFVLAARTLGASNSIIIFKHLLPNLAGVIIINTMFTIPNAIFFEAFLSFIGLGLQDPLASLGTLIYDGFRSMHAFPHQMLIPGIVISMMMIAFNMMADGLRDALDPKMRD